MAQLLLTHIRGLTIVTPWLLYLLSADALLSFLLPFKLFFPNTVYNLSSRIASSVWRWIQIIFQSLNGAVITTSGDPLPYGESAIVVANHIGWSDFYMIQALAIRSGMLGRCRWFAKIQLRMVPFLGWGLWAMGFPLVSRNWGKDKGELERVFSGITARKWPTWLISFSEATRFTPKKYLESKKWCTDHKKPQPEHLLYPRTKGFVTTVQHLRKAPHVKAVYDMTIAYQRGGEWQRAPTMWETLSLPQISREQQKGGAGYKFHVHARRFPLEELPYDDEGLAKWLEERWVEKGQWLEEKRTEWADASS
ncbi:1-acyl-sn-glycerol-3-phosphate acyltransferase [Immersiella caudata]|uniref:1-acyl-sn-glycerol-3-phosphate acyltransferase n=1 Tax=Immersiella caudata TaxID=314043 RepID=A0AA39XEP1_9PEZI|nr:1-acyl-sn-glycerol-3-phosphate acyltransferase [Immersiella caudata]